MNDGAAQNNAAIFCKTSWTLSDCMPALSNKKLSYSRGTARRAVRKFALFYEVRELERFQTTKVTSKVIQGHW